MDNKKVDLHVMIDENDMTKLELFAYNSGKSKGELIRIAIRKLEPGDLLKGETGE